MSRIGKLPITIPDGVEVSVAGSTVSVKGPKGTLEQELLSGVAVGIEAGVATLTRDNESKRTRSYHGLFRKLLDNMVIGVTTGFSRTLVINGVGYRVEQNGDSLVFNLGYSNPIEFPLDKELAATIEGNNKLTISGMNKQRVGQVCAEIRSLRPPEPYKGKGVRYEDEHVRRKIGKAGIK